MIVLTAIANSTIRIYRWIVDNYKYGCDRSDMTQFHIQFSEYMLPRIQYLIDHLHESKNLPCRLNERGEADGTLDLYEWKTILTDIQYSLKQDSLPPQNVTKVAYPSNLIQVTEYLDHVRIQEQRYRRGLQYLAIYYNNIWG